MDQMPLTYDRRLDIPMKKPKRGSRNVYAREMVKLRARQH